MLFLLLGLLAFFLIIAIVVYGTSRSKNEDDDDFPREHREGYFRAQPKNQPTSISRPTTITEWVGEYGEIGIHNLLKDVKGVDDYVLSGLCFKNRYGENSSTEIDHVLINDNGVWVIETKTWAGSIFGSELDDEWEQQKNNGEVKYHRNPVRQNDVHIFALERYLGKNIPFINLVVFFHTDSLNVCSDKVCYSYELQDVVSKKSEIKLTSSEKYEIYNNLCEVLSTNQISKKEHYQNINNKKAR